MKGIWICYSKAELAFIEARKALPRRDLYEAFAKKFARRDVTFDALKQLCTRKGWRTGRDGKLAKGNIPANKGKKMPFNANSAKTQFKKGQQPANTKHAGHERVNVDGYVEISINQTNPHTGFNRRYVHKHRWLWEQAHGPIPDGMCLKCKGDKLDTDPSNWDLIPRSLLPRLNGKSGRNYDGAPPELKATIMAVAKLEQKIRARSDRS